MWCVLWLLSEGHKRWNHTSHNGDVENNIDVLNIWNCLHSEDSNWRWHLAYIELRFSFTNGLVFNMSKHWALVLWFHVCIRSPWFNCAFVSILPFNVCCDNLLADSFFFTSPFVRSRSSLLLCNTVWQDWTKSRCCQQDGAGPFLFLSQGSILPNADDGSHAQCITNTLKSESHSKSKEVWTFCEVTNYLSLALSLFFHRFVPHHRIKYIWDLD